MRAGCSRERREEGKRILENFLDISRQSECAVTMLTQVEQSTNLYEFSERTRLRWTWSREAEEAAGESRPDQGMERERAFE